MTQLFLSQAVDQCSKQQFWRMVLVEYLAGFKVICKLHVVFMSRELGEQRELGEI